MNPVTWFEIPAIDLEKSKDFYQKVFQIEMQTFEMGPSLMAWFPSVEGGMGATGTLIKTEGYIPSHEGTVVYFTVDSIEDTLGRVEANGGKMLVPKTSIGEYGWIAQFEDIEGNRVALHSEK